MPLHQLNRTRYTSEKIISALGLTLAVLLLVTGAAGAQAGTGEITVNACHDQNADGVCADSEGTLLGAEACLNDETTCQAVPATFTQLAAGEYTPFLRFSGATLGYYPTTVQTPITLADDETAGVTLGAVYPVHPKGVAVHEALNKVYAAFQGPVIDGQKPYPFVAVIDGETDEVLRTIPGGENGTVPNSPAGLGVGRGVWGVAVPTNGEFVYVGSFDDGIITIIDPETDTVVTSVSPGAPFNPTSPTINPVTGRVHFPDYGGGRMVVVNDDPVTFPTQPLISVSNITNPPAAFSPFEVAVAKSLQSYNYVTLRDAFSPNPYKLSGFNTGQTPPDFFDILIGNDITGVPHAAALWQSDSSDEGHLFVTYADDPRSTGETFPNPNKVLLYDFSNITPNALSLRRSDIAVGDYAEVGLLYNPATNHMLGTYAGFPYINTEGDEAACNNPARGGTYALDSDGNMLAGEAAGVWKVPALAVGNPPFEAEGMQWRNPFEIAINPNNGKVYVTDRCWNDYPTGGQAGGGAVLIFTDTTTGEPGTPTPTVTGTPPTATPDITGTPDVTTTPGTGTPSVTGTPAGTGTPSVTETPGTGTPGATETPGIGTGTPGATETPGTGTGTPGLTETPGSGTGTPSVTETPGTGTGTPTVTGTPPTATPTPNLTGTPGTGTPDATQTPGSGTHTPTPPVTETPGTGTGTPGPGTGTPDVTSTPDGTGTPVGTSTPTPFGTPTNTPLPTATPPQAVDLAFNGPATAASGQTFNVDVEAQNVAGLGIYGIQILVNFDQTLISINEDSLAVNPNLSFVVFAQVDNATGTITVLASRQGAVPGLTGDVTLFTFEATAIGASGDAIFSFDEAKIGDPQSNPYNVVSQSYMVSIQPSTTPTITPDVTGTPGATETPGTGTGTPSATETPGTGTGTPSATETPGTGTGTPSVTETPGSGTGTPSATETPGTGTGTPSVTETPGSGTSTPGATETPGTGTGTPGATETPGPGTPTATATPGDDLTMSGIVFDADLGPMAGGLSNAVVSVTTCEAQNFQATTLADGSYSLFLPGTSLDPCESVTLSAESEGFQSVSQQVTVADLRDQPQRNFPMVRIIVEPTSTPTPGTTTPTVTGTPPTATSTPTPDLTGTPGTGTPSVTETPGTGTPSVTETPDTGTGTPSATETPGTGTGTPIATETPGTGTGTPSATETPGTGTGTPSATETPGTGTPSATETPGTGTGTPSVTETPGTGTGTPSATETPGTGTGTPSATETPGTGTGTPSATETPGTGTGTPSATETPGTGTGTPSATETPGTGTGTPSVTETPGTGTGTPSVTETPGTGTGTPSVTETPGTGTGTPSATETPGIGTGTPSATETPGTGTGTPSATETPGTGTGTPSVTETPGTGTGTPGATSTPDGTGTPPAGTPTITPTPTGIRVIIIIGQVLLPGRINNDWSGTTVMVEDVAKSTTTSPDGNFSLTDLDIEGGVSIVADAPGYLPARCTLTQALQPEVKLNNAALLSGDVNDDDAVDITDAVAVGVGIGAAGNQIPTDINRSEDVDVFDLILVGINYGNNGPQEWNCSQ